MQCDF